MFFGADPPQTFSDWPAMRLNPTLSEMFGHYSPIPPSENARDGVGDNTGEDFHHDIFSYINAILEEPFDIDMDAYNYFFDQFDAFDAFDTQPDIPPTPAPPDFLKKCTMVVLISPEQCAVCIDTMTGGRRLPCGHIFHDHCLASWFKCGNTCPVCRKLMTE